MLRPWNLARICWMRFENHFNTKLVFCKNCSDLIWQVYLPLLNRNILRASGRWWGLWDVFVDLFNTNIISSFVTLLGVALVLSLLFKILKLTGYHKSLCSVLLAAILLATASVNMTFAFYWNEFQTKHRRIWQGGESCKFFPSTSGTWQTSPSITFRS